MRILLSNDDGYRAPGIVALYEALKSFASVEVIAPEHNNSAKSNALTLNAPLYVTRASNGFQYINGTPADCVHVALTGLLDFKPDLVVSGINNGANMGDDTIYSGTVGAAMEGYLFGIPAIAFSQVDKGWARLQDAAQAAADFVRQFDPALSGHAKTAPWLLNVNIPNLPCAQIKNALITRLGKRHAAEPVVRQVNPRGETMFWIGAAGPASDDGAGTDFAACRQGHMSVTPLQVDLTDHAALGAWRERLQVQASAAR